MNTAKDSYLLAALVRIDKLPANGHRMKVVAEKDKLPAIAQYTKIQGVEHFSADLRITGFKGGVRVSGRLFAEISQPCVVSLVPLTQIIDEPVERVFLFGPDINSDAGAGSESFIDLSADEIPDYIEGSELDLSVLLLEVLGLAIELYPRATGAKISPQQTGGEPEKRSPFAVLRAKKAVGTE